MTTIYHLQDNERIIGLAPYDNGWVLDSDNEKYDDFRVVNYSEYFGEKRTQNLPLDMLDYLTYQEIYNEFPF